MTEQQQQIEALRQKCEDWAAKMPPHGNYKHQEANIAKAGLFQEAGKLITTATTSTAWSANDKQALTHMLEHWLPKVIAPWGKDERKKLKMASLQTTR
jgi:hypothetical protein